ncbi:MAG TPA: cobalt-precorrin 5A hydrolase [Desulfobacteria bacterium]|nr:cobalt-precorrin 5A hydrolase [Desulfobacteria bacterium]
MKIAIVALTANGANTANRLAARLQGAVLPGGRAGAVAVRQAESVEVFLPAKLVEPDGRNGVQRYTCSTAQQLKELFGRYEAIICLMATGIVVRSIAPLLRGKAVDPAVVVIDENGQFAISLLSGHLGGANDLAREAARALHGIPVITTATDVQGYLAVDVLANDMGAKPEPIAKLEPVNSAIAAGETVELFSEAALPLGKDHPVWHDARWRVHRPSEAGATGQEFLAMVQASTATAGRRQDVPVVVTAKLGPEKFLYLRPPVIVAGIGCRRGVSGKRILRAILAALDRAGRSPLSLKKLASIEAKTDEAGIIWAARELGVPVEFFSVTVLREIIAGHEGLAKSDFVNKQMGVGGVCEPASLAGCRQGRLVLGKQANEGITVALAEEEFGS